MRCIAAEGISPQLCDTCLLYTSFDVESKLMPVVNDVQGFYDWIVGESKAFRNVMREYGQRCV